MTRIIAVANQKGGVGKTTTTISLGVALSREGQRVLLVDLDPQAALSVSLGLAVAQLRETVYRVLLSEVPVEQAIRGTHSGPDILPANIDLSAAELELAAQMGRERFLAEALQSVSAKYDFILLDLPPSLGLLTVNALVAANEVIIPVQCEYLAVRALTLLLSTIDKVKAKLNPSLAVAGILPTMYNGRTLHSQEVLDEIRTTFRVHVFPMVIKHSVRFKEAPAAGLSIIDYAPAQDGANAYQALAKELLQ